MADDLIARLEAATEGGQDLDKDIARHLGFRIAASTHRPMIMRQNDDVASWDLPRYTRSLDAAVKVVLKGWWWSLGLCDLTGHASTAPDYNGPHGDRLRKKFPEADWHEGIHADLKPGDTIDRACIALCVVGLRARDATKEPTDG